MHLPNHSLTVFWEGKLEGAKINQTLCLSTGEWVNKLRAPKQREKVLRSYKNCPFSLIQHCKVIGLACKRIILRKEAKQETHGHDCMRGSSNINPRNVNWIYGWLKSRNKVAWDWSQWGDKLWTASETALGEMCNILCPSITIDVYTKKEASLLYRIYTWVSGGPAF